MKLFLIADLLFLLSTCFVCFLFLFFFPNSDACISHKPVRTFNFSLLSIFISTVLREHTCKRERPKLKRTYNWYSMKSPQHSFRERERVLLFILRYWLILSMVLHDSTPFSLTCPTHLQHYCLTDHSNNLQKYVILYKIYM